MASFLHSVGPRRAQQHPGRGMCQHACFNLGFSWNDARHYCQSVRTELTSIHSRAEIEFIRNLNFTKNTCKQLTCTYDMFCHLVGWGWTDKTSLGFVNWAQGEPNSAFHPGDIAEENCVEMYLDGHWNDNNCLQKRGFACHDGKNPIFPTDSPGGSK
uniref:C-type lectin domain-containing protein n=1 Tax=Xiphophorus couchianus TaxID=32473 RepID=A0A3B5KWE5_9TELE